MSTFDGIVTALVKAYFQESNIAHLSSLFRHTTTNWVEQSKTWSPDTLKSHPAELTEIVLAFLMSLLVEHGDLPELARMTASDLKNSLGKICEISFDEKFCNIQSPLNFTKWTHSTLQLITSLVNKKIPFVDYSNNKVTDFELKEVSEDFVHKVIILLYAFLMLRLAYLIVFLSGESTRHEVEECLFMTIIYFYSHYVHYRRTLSMTDPVVTMWDDLYYHVTETYLYSTKVFSTLKTYYPLVAYLDQDNVGKLQMCIGESFVRAQVHTMFTPHELPSTRKAFKCLMDINLNSLSARFNRFLRWTTTNKFSSYAKNIVSFTIESGTAVAGFVKKSYVTASELTDRIYSDSYPIPSKAGQIAAGIIAFAGTLLKGSLLTGTKALGSGAKAAFVYCFFKKDVEDPQTKLRFYQPNKPSYLVWKRAKDGKMEAVYTVYMLPRLIDDSLVYGQFQFGGIKGDINDGKRLLDHMKKGYLVQDIPSEMQAKILAVKKKLGVKRQFGGGTYEILDDGPVDPDYDYDVIDTAEDNAQIIEDADEYKLILPIPPLQKLALENTVFVSVPEPAAVVEPQVKEDIIPPVMQSTTRLIISPRKHSTSKKRKNTKQSFRKRKSNRKRSSGKKRKSSDRKRSSGNKRRYSNRKRKISNRKRKNIVYF